MLITKNHFGGHLILTKDLVDNGGPTDRLQDLIEFQSFRYPGGTVTENLDHLNGSLDAIFGDQNIDQYGAPLLTVKDAFAFAQEHEANLQFVLPTKTFFIGAEVGNRTISTVGLNKLLQYVDGMIRGDFGAISIDTFEIGNEYWAVGDPLTASEYGQIANLLAKDLQTLFDTYQTENPIWVQPSIAVQSGASWISGDNDKILSELDMDARAAIDGVVSHFYPADFAQAGDSPVLFKNMQDFHDAPGFGDMRMIVSEWNLHAADNGDRGLAQASSMLRQFDYMVRNGVDQANVWGTNFKFLDTSLSTISDNPGGSTPSDQVKLQLDAPGELFRILMQSLEGASPVDLPADQVFFVQPDSAKVSTFSFSSNDRMVIFVASRTTENVNFQLNLDELAQGYENYWARTISAVDDVSTVSINEGEATSKQAIPVVATLNKESLGDGSIDLSSHELVVLEFAVQGSGLTMEGQVSPQLITGSENDVLVGESGDDVIRGNYGDDVIVGGLGRNIIDGGLGNDTLFGGQNCDLIFAGEGDNVIETGAGRNVVVAGTGSDQIVGGGDGDLFVTADGGSEITGNGGGDYFLFAGNGTTTVQDFDPAVDQLDFGGRLTGANLSDVVSVQWNDTVGRYDLLIAIPNGPSVVLVGAGDQQANLSDSIIDGLSASDRFSSLLPYIEGLTPQQGEMLIAETMVNGSNVILGNVDPATIAGALPTELGVGILSISSPGFVNSREQNIANESDATTDVLGRNNPCPPEEQSNSSESGEIEAGSGCFVATAAYRDPWHPDVVFLRYYRDTVLQKSRVGRYFISFYLHAGPIAARCIEGREWARLLTKKLISCLIVFLAFRSRRS